MSINLSQLLAASHSYLLRNIAIPLADMYFKQNLRSRLAFLEEAQFWSRDRIIEYRNQQLRQLIHTTESEIPMYAKLWAEHGVCSSDIKCKDDLLKLPIVDKSNFRPFDHASMIRRTNYRQYRSYSSGSTGENFFVYEDSEISGIARASLLLAWQWVGWSIGDPHLQTGMSVSRNFERRLKDWFFSCYYVLADNLTDSVLDQHLKVMEKKNIRFIMGYPGTLFFLAKRASELGWNKKLEAIMTWGDNLAPRERQLIEETFKCVVSDSYGCTEGHVSAQAGGQKYIIFSTDVCIEFVNEDLQCSQPEEQGAILLTRLCPGPMPLIRYRVGDLGIAGDNQPINGCGFETMHSINGREFEYIPTPGGSRLLVHIFEACIAKYQEVEAFQVVQTSDTDLLIRLKPNSSIKPETISTMQKELITRCGNEMNIDIAIVDSIPLTVGGKRRLLIRKAENDRT